MVSRAFITLFFVLVTVALLPHGSEGVGVQQTLRRISSSVLFGYLPGYWLTRAWFEKNDLTFLERSGMSILVSLAYIVVVGLYLQYFGVAISTGVLILVSIVLIVLSYCIEIMKPSSMY